MRRVSGAAALAALVALAAPALAQPSQPAPPTPRTGPRAEPPPLPAFPQPAPGLAVPATPPAAPPAAGGTIVLQEVRVEPPAAVRPALPPRAWAPPTDPSGALRLSHAAGESLDDAWVRRQFAENGFPGPEARVARALALIQLINRAYLSAGFINSGVVARPSPSPSILQLAVIYGGLSAPAEGVPPLSVEWNGGDSKGLNAAYVRDRMPSAFRRPLNALRLERDFRLLAEDPAIRTINADLRPGARPGEASLGVSVYPQDRFDLYVTAANDRAPTVGGERAAIGGSVRNLVVPGSLLAFEAGITEGLEDAAATFGAPFFSPKYTLTLRADYNEAAIVAQPLNLLDIDARDRTFEGGISRKLVEEPLLPNGRGGWTPARTLSAGMLVTNRVSKTYLAGLPFSFAPGSVDGRAEYTALRFVGDYISRDVDQVAAVALTATFGLDGTRVNLPDVLSPKEDFHVLLAQVNYARRLNASGMEVRARLVGQLTDSVLFSGERLSAGGETTVRGYRENAQLSDNGAIASVELAWPFSLSGPQGRARGFDWGAFSASTFVDGAYLRNHKPPHPERWMSSVGVSLAWTPSDAVLARITYAYALNDLEIDEDDDLQDQGVHFRITVRPLRLIR